MTPQMHKNTLYLIPTPIGRNKENEVLPEFTIQKIHSIENFVVEKAQSAFSFLKWIKHPLPDYKLTVRVLNKKTPDHEIISFMKLLEQGDVGIMSEAGAPGVADPGSKMVKMAHEQGYPVVPLVGPSSILLALMGSGLNGQKFAFHGYLPINENDRIKELKNLENESSRHNQTQIFMETPHRNELLFDQILKNCSPSTQLCVAANLTMPDQLLKTDVIHNWKQNKKPELQKIPALFLIHAG